VAAGERKRGRGEVRSEQNESEIEKGRHLRLRRVVAELEVTPASRFGHRSGGLPSSGGSRLRGRGWKRRRGSARGFIGRGCCGVEGRERGTAMAFHPAAFHVARWLAVAVAPSAGEEWKALGKKRKGTGRDADGRGQRRSGVEEENARGSYRAGPAGQ